MSSEGVCISLAPSSSGACVSGKRAKPSGHERTFCYTLWNVRSCEGGARVDTLAKLDILADAAKYDAACTSSGVERRAQAGRVGAASAAGCCHAFTADGRCITLLKVLLSNACRFDCAYCVNRRSHEIPRATFSPRELAELTMDFYRRNYIEGLFLSSGVFGTPDATCERMIECLRILREELRFNGYVHAKAIPHAAPELLDRLGRYADRLSMNIELPSADSLSRLCPDKDRASVLGPMGQIRDSITSRNGRRKRIAGRVTQASAGALVQPADAAVGGLPAAASGEGTHLAQERLLVPSGQALRARAPQTAATHAFAPAGQSTQLIIGATPEDDRHILTLSRSLYHSFGLRRVFFSAYMPCVEDARLPERETPVPLRREHRLYQADWLMRFYNFEPTELVSPDAPWLDLDVDPKLAWALAHMERFPVEVNTASEAELLRVPGIGPTSARRIVAARKQGSLGFDDLRRMRVTLKRAIHFLSCRGQREAAFPADPELIRARVLADARTSSYNRAQRLAEQQLSLF